MKNSFFLLPLLHSEEISDHVYVNNLSSVHLKDHPQITLINSSWKNHTDVLKNLKDTHIGIRPLVENQHQTKFSF